MLHSAYVQFGWHQTVLLVAFFLWQPGVEVLVSSWEGFFTFSKKQYDDQVVQPVNASNQCKCKFTRGHLFQAKRLMM